MPCKFGKLPFFTIGSLRLLTGISVKLGIFKTLALWHWLESNTPCLSHSLLIIYINSYRDLNLIYWNNHIIRNISNKTLTCKLTLLSNSIGCFVHDSIWMISFSKYQLIKIFITEYTRRPLFIANGWCIKIWTKFIIALNVHNFDILTLEMKQTCYMNHFFEHITINGWWLGSSGWGVQLANAKDVRPGLGSQPLMGARGRSPRKMLLILAYSSHFWAISFGNEQPLHLINKSWKYWNLEIRNYKIKLTA